MNARKRPMTFRLAPDVARLLAEEAARRGITMTELVEMGIVWMGLTQKERFDRALREKHRKRILCVAPQAREIDSSPLNE